MDLGFVMRGGGTVWEWWDCLCVRVRREGRKVEKDLFLLQICIYTYSDE